MDTDQNGDRVTKGVHRITDGEYVQGRMCVGECVGAWTRRVWWGGGHLGAIAPRQYVYDTRATAQAGDISHHIGEYGRIA